MLANHIAWAAGLFEGEGCITHTDKRYTRLKLKMTDRDVVERFCKIVGVGKVLPAKPSKAHYKPLFEWTCQRREDVHNILDTFLPYFGDRRAHKALDILDLLECS